MITLGEFINCHSWDETDGVKEKLTLYESENDKVIFTIPMECARYLDCKTIGAEVKWWMQKNNKDIRVGVDIEDVKVNELRGAE